VDRVVFSKFGAPMTSLDRPQVFVGSSQTDRAVVGRLVGVLEKHDLTIRWDADLPASQDLVTSIAEALDDAVAVVVVWSAASARSPQVLKAADRAMASDKLVPVSFDGPRTVPPPFSTIHTIDLTGWKGDEGDARLQDLLKALEERAGGWNPKVQASQALKRTTRPQAAAQLTSEGPSEIPEEKIGPGPQPSATFLRPAARELLDFTATVATARRAPAVANLDVVLAALVRSDRTKLDKRELDRGATSALVRALPEPPAERIAAALSAADVDTSELQTVQAIDPDDPRVAPVVQQAYRLMQRLGADAIWSHHLVGVALAGDPLPDDVLAPLGVSQHQMNAALREGIATRWGSESPEVWDSVLGSAPPSGVPTAVSLHPAALAVLGWAAEVRRARGGDQIDDLDVLLGALASARWGASEDSGLALYRTLPSTGGSPSQRLSAAFGAVGIPTVPDRSAEVPPEGAVRSPTVTRAAAIAQRTSGAPIAWPRHLLTAALAGDPLPAGVSNALGCDGETLRRSLRASIATAWPDEAADAWDAELLGVSEIDLTAAFASDYVAVRRRGRPGEPPAPALEDHLGVDVYVGMLATLIARKTTTVPLSIGLFGEWGSGKSYFMELIRQRVDALAAGAAGSSDSPYHDDIVQVRFNAWHYADTNLWASLAAEFFDQLADPDTDPIESRREKVQERLASAHQVRLELEASTRAAEARTEELRNRLARASAERIQRSRRLDADLLRAVANDPLIRDQLADLSERLGLAGKQDEVLQIGKDLRSIDDDVTATRRVIGHQSLRWPFVLLLLVLVGLALALAAPEGWTRWLQGSTVAVVAALVTNVGLIIGRSRQLARDLRTTAEKAEEIEAQLLSSDKDLSDLARQVHKAEADEAVAQARVDEVLALIADLDRQLVELNPGRRLYQFLAERAASTDYRSQLGVISLVRRDFEQLVALMEDWRLHPTPSDENKPIDRIVLYIDDLDRCEPDQVVAVLQAVHLLLAMDLFVVVVGVDPRWLLRSLRRRYRAVLGAAAVAASDRDLGFSESTPQNYLEKIFQVPFVLPGMDQRGFTRLVNFLARPASSPGAAGEATSTGELQGGAGANDNGDVIRPQTADETPVSGAPPVRPAGPSEESAEARSEVAAVVLGRHPAVSTPITDPELSLLSALADLVRTPRAAIRLFNLYGLLRSTRDLTEGGRFLGGPGHPGDYEAVAQLLGILTGAPQLLGTLLWGQQGKLEDESRGLCRAGRARSWRSFVDRLEPREDGTWSNDVADSLSVDEVQAWQSLVVDLRRVRGHVELDDIERYRLWGPRIARFSFLLSPFADGAHPTR
jgi:hypothetical protein